MYRFNLAVTLAALAGASVLSAQVAFQAATTFPTGLEPDGGAFFDLDGDGDLDLAVTVDAPDRVEIYTNNGGTFTFASSVLVGNGTSPHAIAAADFDHDGDRDLAVTLKNVNQVQILMNVAGVLTSSGSFATGSDPREIESADLNADGFVDLVTSNRDGNSLTVALSVGGVFGGSATVATAAEPRELALADFDGNGTNDVAVAAHDARVVQVFTSNGGVLGLFASLSTGDQLRPEGLAAADVNNDGFMDLLAGTSGNGFNNLSVWIQSGGGAFGVRADYPVGGLDPSSVVAGDLDGDGDVDAATANQDGNSITLMVNAGAGTFLASGTLATGLSPTKLFAADVNNDGGLDLATVNDDGSSASIFRNLNGRALSALVDPFVGSLGIVQIAVPAHAGEGYFCGFSKNTTGLSLPGGSVLPLAFDGLLRDSLFSGSGAFRNTVGILDANGRAQVRLHVFPDASLAGARFNAAAVMLGAVQPISFGTVYGPLPLRVR